MRQPSPIPQTVGTTVSPERIRRLIRDSGLPDEFGNDFDLEQLPLPLHNQVRSLQDGAFLAEAGNVLVFGEPGSGKTRLLSALARQLLQQGHRVAWWSGPRLLEELTASGRVSRRLAECDAVVIDDFDRTRGSRAELNLLYSLASQRCERRSILIGSTLPPSACDQVFHHPILAAKAADRLAYHSTTITLPGYWRHVESVQPNKVLKYYDLLLQWSGPGGLACCRND